MLICAAEPLASAAAAFIPACRLAALVALCCAFTACGGETPGQPAEPAGISASLAELEAAPCPDSIDPLLFSQLKAELKRVLLARPQPKTAAAVPSTDLSAAAITHTGSELVWYYYSQGDYDQNGEVNIADLTPLGMYFGTAGPFDWRDALSCVDGDNNGELNIADVTPIGLNYGNRVEGYHIYQSSSQADYPPGNLSPNGAGAVQTLSVPFGNAVSAAGKRLRFSAAYPAMAPGDHIWARPYLGVSEGTASKLYSPGGVWHVSSVVDGEPGDMSGRYCSLAVIGGRPAIAYISREKPMFIRATDARGTGWGSAIDVAGSATAGARMTSLASINGLPGIAFLDKQHSCVAYTQAADANGTSWATPAVIEDCPVEYRLSLAEVNLRAAVVFDQEKPVPGPTATYYERAGDSVGTDWTAVAEEIDGIFDGEYPMLAIIDGMPGVAFRDYASGAWYVRSLDINGNAWAAPEQVQGLFNVLSAGARPWLTAVAGTPAVSYQVEGIPGAGMFPNYARAADPQGSMWIAPAPLSLDTRPNPNSGGFSSMAALDGGVYVAYYDAGNTQLRCIHATDHGTLWEDPEVIDVGGGNDVGQFVSMAVVDGHAAVAYYDADAEALKYAILY